MILFNITVEERNMQFLYNLPLAVLNAVVPVIEQQSKMMAEGIRQKYFTSSFGMYSQNSELYTGILKEGTLVTEDSVVGGVQLGGRKTAMFVGPVGKQVTVRPKVRKALAIPTTKAAYLMQKSVGSLRDIGNLERGPGGLFFKGQDKKGIPPFVLRTSAKTTTFKPKLHPEQIATEYLVPVTVALRGAIFNALKGV